MSKIVAYCRSGYESDTAAELTETASQHNFFGYPSLVANSGYVIFQFYQDEHAQAFVNQIGAQTLVFARQVFAVLAEIEPLPERDRVGAIIEQLIDWRDNMPGEKTLLAGDIMVEYPDTDDGKSVAKFARKVTTPLRQALRKGAFLTPKDDPDKSRLHVFLPDFGRAFIGISFVRNRNAHHNGIHRLRFPNQAPSRSTLKLEEAILDLLNEQQRQDIFREGARAVDLGACPGGWTYQLVSRGMHVEAVDNGAMAESLMKTGQVSYFAADGFKYRPEFGTVQLLVCDMIEQPDRVAHLMRQWLERQYAQAAIFNLKLPMKKRYQTVTELLAYLHEGLSANFTIRCKQLYHNRDEVTLAIIPRNPN